jgi:hypothetical protein
MAKQKGTSASIYTSIPKDMYDKLAAVAAKNRRSIAGQLAYILEIYLRKVSA